MTTIELFEIALKNIYEKKGEQVPDFITRLIQETKGMENDRMKDSFNEGFRSGWEDAISSLIKNKPSNFPINFSFWSLKEN